MTPANPADAFSALIEAAVASGIKKALDFDADTNKRLLSVEQAATYLALSEREIHNMIAGHDLPAVKRGRRVLLDVRDLNGWIERSKTRAA